LAQPNSKGSKKEEDENAAEIQKALDTAAECIQESQEGIMRLSQVHDANRPAMEDIAKSLGQLADAATFSMEGFGGEIYTTRKMMTDLAMADARRESESEALHNRVEEQIIKQLGIITSRLDALENKPAQPNPELEKLRSDLAKTQKVIDDLNAHRTTLEELEIMRQNKFQKWVQALGKKTNDR
jgi:DNA repair exonuclease SbcCD ATPase subunit